MRRRWAAARREDIIAQRRWPSPTRSSGLTWPMSESGAKASDLRLSMWKAVNTSTAGGSGRICAACGKAFQPLYPRERYCGDDCRSKTKRDRNRKWMHGHHQAKAPHISDDELERLRLPQFRLEALAYGPDKQPVCLWCGWMGQNLSRHVSACPKMPLTIRKELAKRPEGKPKLQESAAYKEEWGYNRSNPLMSKAERGRRSATRATESFQIAFAGKVAPAFAAKRAEQGEARERGAKRDSGRMRLESRLKRSGQKLGPRADRKAAQSVQKVAVRDLNLRESAKAAGVSENKFYRLATASDPEWGRKRRERRAVIQRYLFDLRQWVWSLGRAPTLDEILDRQTDGVLGGAEPFRSFMPFVDALKVELIERPWKLKELVRKKRTSKKGMSSGPVIKLAAQILERVNRGAAAAASASPKPAAAPATGGRQTLRRKRTRLRLTPQVARYLDLLELTARQKEVAVFKWAHGLSNKEIARRLKITPQAVRQHVTAIHKKSAKKGPQLRRVLPPH